MSRYHVGDAWGRGMPQVPYFGFSIISALDALARLGYTLEEPKIAAAVEYLLSRQLPDGAWPLDDSWSHSPIDFGQPGEPNKWLTLMPCAWSSCSTASSDVERSEQVDNTVPYLRYATAATTLV